MVFTVKLRGRCGGAAMLGAGRLTEHPLWARAPAQVALDGAGVC